jgi:GMP synthase-like glutamine amidotransferase
MMNRKTIGILVTNTDNSEFASRWPRDGEKFTTLLQQARPHWTCAVYDCTQGQFPKRLEDHDGYVIGGSPASVNDTSDWIATLFEVIRNLDQRRTPTVGCCFGHQAISVALGGTVGRNPGGWGFGVSPTYYAASEPWMTPQKSTIRLYAAHSEQTLTLPRGARILGGDDFCPAASLAIGDHIVTTEYHPEMTKPFFMGLTHAFETYIGSDIAARARRQANESDADGPLFGTWMANFLDMNRSS